MMKNKRICFGMVGCVVLLACVISFVYWGNRKEIWFCDEVYSYESANGFEQQWPASEENVWMTGAQLESFFAANGDGLSLESVSVRLYNDHVPLYFWLFRIVSYFGFSESGSIWIGLGINLVFYLALVAIVYRVFVKLTDNPPFAGGVVFLTCIVNRLMLNQATMVRMYMLLLLEAVLLLGAGLRILRNVESKRLNVGNFVYLFLVSVAGLLTHYDFWIFYAVTAALFCTWLLVLGWKRKARPVWSGAEWQAVLLWCVNFVTALLTTIALFPYCRWNLNTGKGQMALGSLLVFDAKKWENICWGYSRLSASVFGEAFPTALGLLLIFGCIAGGAYLLWRSKEKGKLVGMLLVVLIAQAYQVVVCFTLPAAQEERYLWVAFTLMMFCAMFGGGVLMYNWWKKFETLRLRKVIGLTMTGAVSLFLLVLQIIAIDGGNGVAYLFHPDKDVCLLEEHREKCWVVFGAVEDVYSYFDWTIPEQICFLNPEKSEEAEEALKKVADLEGVVLYCKEECLSEALELFAQVFGKELKCEHLTNSTNYGVYTIDAI